MALLKLVFLEGQRANSFFQGVPPFDRKTKGFSGIRTQDRAWARHWRLSLYQYTTATTTSTAGLLSLVAQVDKLEWEQANKQGLTHSYLHSRTWSLHLHPLPLMTGSSTLHLSQTGYQDTPPSPLRKWKVPQQGRLYAWVWSQWPKCSAQKIIYDIAFAHWDHTHIYASVPISLGTRLFAHGGRHHIVSCVEGS